MATPQERLQAIMSRTPSTRTAPTTAPTPTPRIVPTPTAPAQPTVPSATPEAHKTKYPILTKLAHYLFPTRTRIKTLETELGKIQNPTYKNKIEFINQDLLPRIAGERRHYYRADAPLLDQTVADQYNADVTTELKRTVNIKKNKTNYIHIDTADPAKEKAANKILDSVVPSGDRLVAEELAKKANQPEGHILVEVFDNDYYWGEWKKHNQLEGFKGKVRKVIHSIAHADPLYKKGAIAGLILALFGAVGWHAAYPVKETETIKEVVEVTKNIYNNQTIPIYLMNTSEFRDLINGSGLEDLYDNYLNDNNLEDNKEAVDNFLDNLTGEDVEKFDFDGFKNWAADEIYEPGITFLDEYQAWAEQNDREDNFESVYDFFQYAEEDINERMDNFLEDKIINKGYLLPEDVVDNPDSNEMLKRLYQNSIIIGANGANGTTYSELIDFINDNIDLTKADQDVLANMGKNDVRNVAYTIVKDRSEYTGSQKEIDALREEIRDTEDHEGIRWTKKYSNDLKDLDKIKTGVELMGLYGDLMKNDEHERWIDAFDLEGYEDKDLEELAEIFFNNKVYSIFGNEAMSNYEPTEILNFIDAWEELGGRVQNLNQQNANNFNVQDKDLQEFKKDVIANGGSYRLVDTPNDGGVYAELAPADPETVVSYGVLTSSQVKEVFGDDK